MTTPARASLRNAAVLAVTLTALWSASGALDSLDAQLRLRVAEQLLAERGLVVEGHGNSAIGSSLRDAHGAYPSRFGIGQSLFFLPFVAVSRPLAELAPISETARPKVARFLFSTAVFVFVLLAVFGLCVITARALGADPLTAYLAAFVGVFGSSFWQMAKQGQEENQLAIAALLALYGLVQWRRAGAAKYVWLSAGSVAVAMIFRPTAITLVLGVVGAYAAELWRLRRRALPVVGIFGLAGAAGLAVIFGYNTFKAGHPLRFGYAIPDGTFTSSTWGEGLWGATLGLDRGIIWQNLWLAPGALLVVLGWRRLGSELRLMVALVGFLFVSSVALHAAWIGWHGGLNYGTRFQQNVVPLLGLTLVLGSLETGEARRWIIRWATVLALATAALQLPSISFVHSLEGFQALVSGARRPSGGASTVSMGGMLRLRLANVAAKLAIGSPVPIDTLASQRHLLGLLTDMSRWDFWPWRLSKYLGSGVTRAAKVVWLALLVSSIVAWTVVFRRARRDAVT